MKILLKAVRSSKDLTCLFNYCENNGIEMLREGRAMTLENIQTGVIKWHFIAAYYFLFPAARHIPAHRTQTAERIRAAP